MPEMTGMQLAWAIREDARLSATRLILLSCMGSNVTLSDMAHSGFSAYLSKPVQRRELLNCLTTVLAQPAGKWQMENPRGTTKTSSSRRPDSALYEGHVLVVDDNLVNQKVAQRYLERLGCTVTIAGDGEEAVCRHSTTRFDLILMDLQMPKMDGYEAARRIRTAEPAGVPRTPIVALTADAMTASIDAALAAGMDHFLTKPIEIAPLRDALDRFLRLSNGTPIAARN